MALPYMFGEVKPSGSRITCGLCSRCAERTRPSQRTMFSSTAPTLSRGCTTATFRCSLTFPSSPASGRHCGLGGGGIGGLCRALGGGRWPASTGAARRLLGLGGRGCGGPLLLRQVRLRGRPVVAQRHVLGPAVAQPALLHGGLGPTAGLDH